ncbi:hypothetical protein B7G68_13420 [Caulobacter segnis]|uniref:Lipoprotein n=2 Tax=Caulobacter segnis TaxID=88688 RepID=D5VKQ2_CAUST|nr:hypothetical protein [Caulobacter segnis]ADG11075.1 hypothetical protein Cseg_2624 [Caulobacter segnis ATCC 21756]AVQ02763.1 hypothetical protein B7G68_13420 [Caulobacter segnis]
MRTWRLTILTLLLAATAACDGQKKDRKAEAPPAPASQTAPATPSPPTTQPTELVSLAWRPSNSNQNLQAFDLEVSGLDVLAVCHVPPGWTINATGAGEGVTALKGQATVGAAFVSLDDMEDIAGLFLVRARPSETFAVKGDITTGTYGGDQTEIQATTALLRREAADRCPPPKG